MQSVWHVKDISNLARGGIALAPSWEFAAGIAWLANQMGAAVPIPERREPVQIEVAEVYRDEE